MNEKVLRCNYVEFTKWCRQYIIVSMDVVSYCEKQNNQDYKSRYIDEYKKAKIMVRQYELLKLSISKQKLRLLEECLVGNKELPYRRSTTLFLINIFKQWKKICFKKEKLIEIVELDKKQLAKNLKFLREVYGYSLTEISEIVGISENTMKAYESGTRTVNIVALYSLSKIYSISLESFFIELI